MTMPIPFSVVFLSGGSGTRMGKEIPKQYLLLNQKPLALHSFELFLNLPEVEEIVVVCEEKYEQLYSDAAKNKGIDLLFALPGARRQDSVFNGIQRLSGNPLACIHDSARPFINANLVRDVVRVAERDAAAVVGVKMKSTIKLCDEAQVVVQTLNRDCLWEIQTPQVVRLKLLKEGFSFANEHQLTVTDDVSLVELIGKPVTIVEGSYANIKITTQEDLNYAEFFREIK